MLGRYFIGSLLILLGVGFLFDQMNYWDFSYIISTWWPLIIVLLGVTQLAKKQGAILPGFVLMIVGLLLQANELGYLQYGFWSAFWPLILIAVGLIILFRKFTGKKNHVTTENEVTYTAIFSGVEQTIDSDNFRSASVSAAFGGAEIDLSDAIISPQGAILDLNAIFGGITIRLPRNCAVKTDGFPLFGALENKTRPVLQNDGAAPQILIKYFVAFGGIELKN